MRSAAIRTSADVTAATTPAPLALVHREVERADELERQLLAFDVEEDLMANIAMPPTIPVPIRAAITKAAGQRFTFAAELDEWLHAPHDGLHGRTPFERLVDGDGVAVLVALLDGTSCGDLDRLIAVAWRPGARLKLVR